jgi:hypothetical protein
MLDSVSDGTNNRIRFFQPNSRRSFMKPIVMVSLVAVALAVVSMPMVAHHSISAEFDVNKPIEFRGTVSQVDWLNPHIYTHVAVTQADGSTITYKVEGGPPNSLFRRGWREDSLRPGMIVTVEGIQAKATTSTNVGQATITTEDGTRVFSGSAN